MICVSNIPCPFIFTYFIGCWIATTEMTQFWRHSMLIKQSCSFSRKHRIFSLQNPDLWPPNSPDLKPVHYQIWRLMQKCVEDIHPPYQRLEASISQNVTDEAVGQQRKRMREGKGTSLWTPAKLKRALFRATNSLPRKSHQQSTEEEPPTVYQGRATNSLPRNTRYVSHHFCCNYLKSNKVSKSEGTKIVEYLQLKVSECSNDDENQSREETATRNTDISRHRYSDSTRGQITQKSYNLS